MIIPEKSPLLRVHGTSAHTGNFQKYAVCASEQDKLSVAHAPLTIVIAPR